MSRLKFLTQGGRKFLTQGETQMRKTPPHPGWYFAERTVQLLETEFFYASVRAMPLVS